MHIWCIIGVLVCGFNNINIINQLFSLDYTNLCYERVLLLLGKPLLKYKRLTFDEFLIPAFVTNFDSWITSKE